MATDKYPYFIVPAIEELPSASGEERLRLVRRIAAAVGDPSALRAIIGIDPEEFKRFYPDMQPQSLSTDDTIDSFLDRFGNPQLSAATEIEDIITPVAAPYDLSSLEALPEIGGIGAEIPDMSPRAATVKTPVPETPVPETPVPEIPVPEISKEKQVSTEKPREGGGADLSLSLAKIMIKNGNYQKALEIITEISLNNPKKSIYFADQIRFLKKLIAYTSASEKTDAPNY